MSENSHQAAEGKPCYIGYVRGPFTGKQVEAINVRAELEGWHLSHVYTETTGSIGRPVRDRVLLDLNAGKAEGLIVADWPRLTREPMNAQRFLNMAIEGGWNLVVLDTGSRSDSDELMRAINDALSSE